MFKHLNGSIVLGHIFTFITIAIWSTAFVSNKVLIEYLSPLEIMIFRFVLGYIVLLLAYPHISLPRSLKDESLFFLLGALGIFVYFLFENFALKWTQATNVGLFMGAIPILTAIVSHIIHKDEHFSKNLLIGFFLAMSGMALILFEGHGFKMRFKGDLLALCGALTFALYSSILKSAPSKYHPIVITRKSFFYGLLLMGVYYVLQGDELNYQALQNRVVLNNILYLGIFSSGLAFLLYQQGVKRIGSISASNYIYLVPLLTAVTGVIVLDEVVTVRMTIAGGLILLGLYIAQKRQKA
ncbi:MAG: DMT family transporter [Epsilonproteobacteria bacterium]|nr:DMT family transporter [Campylobacterota bacterium]